MTCSAARGILTVTISVLLLLLRPSAGSVMFFALLIGWVSGGQSGWGDAHPGRCPLGVRRRARRPAGARASRT